MGQKSKNAGKKKQMPPKKKVSCIPKHTAFRVTDTPEANCVFRELLENSVQKRFLNFIKNVEYTES